MENNKNFSLILSLLHKIPGRYPPPHPTHMHKCTVKIPGERPCFVFILDNYPSLIEDLCGFQTCLHVRFIQIVPLKKTDSGATCQICGLNDWRAGPQKLRVSQIPLVTLNSAWVFNNVWIKDLNTSFLKQVYSEAKMVKSSSNQRFFLFCL